MNIDNLINDAKKKSVSEHVNKYDHDINVYGINDYTHLKNHLNYLFRTDYSQKWTNDLTKNNVYIFKNSNNEFDYLIAENETEREYIKENIKTIMKKLARKSNLKMDDFSKRLLQIRQDYLDNKVFNFSEVVEMDTTDFLKSIYHDNPGFEMFCAVIHVDQVDNYVHLHILAHIV